jgi:tRNA U54 and U55 pseudouridine synthase Pus10
MVCSTSMGRATASTRQPLVARDSERKEAAREPVRFATASHEVLFTEARERRCDVCGGPLKRSSEEPATGLYVWARGDEVRREEPPLCETCSTAIFAQALEWEFDEE